MTAGHARHDDGLPSFAELQERRDAPAPSTWGLFGAHDEVGALNLLGPAEALRGAACVRRGAVFSLDHSLGAFDSPQRPQPTHTVIDLGRGWRDDYLDGFYLQATSQIDGLRHVAHHEHGFYNRAPADQLVAGDPTLGVNRWAERGIVGRGVLVDVARHRASAGAPLDHLASEPIGVELLDETLAAQGTSLERGDMLLVRTGYEAHRLEHPGRHGHAGLEQSNEMLAWLWDHRVPLVAADNVALECTPPVATSPFTRPGAIDSNDALMHSHLIALLGMVVGELWDLEALSVDCADDGRYECLLVVKPLNLVGGVGSPPNATAVK